MRKFAIKHKRALQILALLAGVIWLTWLLAVPRIVRAQAAAALQQAGFSPVTMDLPEVGLTTAQVKYLLAGNHLSVGRVWVSYTPWTLLQGRVRQIEIQGLEVWLPLPRRSAPAATGQVPFDTLKLREARVHLPAGGESAAIEGQASTDAQRNLDLTLSATLGKASFTLLATGNPAAGFYTWQSSIRGLDTKALQAWSLPVTSGSASLEGKGTLDLSASPKLAVQSLQVAWSGLELALKPQPVKLQEAKLELAGTIARQEEGWLFELQDQGRFRAAGADVPAITAWGRLGAARLLWREDGSWQAEGQGASVGVSSTRAELQPWKLSSSDAGLQGRLEVQLQPVELRKNRTLERFFPALAAWNPGGKVEGSAFLQWSGGIPASGGLLTLSDVSMVNTAYELSVTGIQSRIELTQLYPPRMPAGQTLKVDYLQLGRWELREALARFSAPGNGALHVESANLGWAGGQLSCEPFDWSPGKAIRTTLSGQELDLGKILWVLTGEKAYAQGTADLRLPVAFKWPQIRLGEGYAQARKGSLLHLTAQAEQLGQWLNAADPRFTTDPAQARVRERLQEALRSFRIETFRADFRREADRLKTDIHLSGAGDKGPNPQAVTLNITAVDLDWLLSRYLATRR